MPTIVQSVDIARSPEDVFAYLDDLERHGEWQSEIVSSKRETDGPTGVGTRATDVSAPLARSQARKQLPEDQRQLKERLESLPPAA